jgi:hypothetical protein
MRETLSLPTAVFELIDAYMNLPLGGKAVPCPYHMNVRKERVGLRVLVGKGDPKEIVQEVKIWSKIKDFDLDKATNSQIREFMIDRSIGIDCSGFIVHIMGYVSTKYLKKKLPKSLGLLLLSTMRLKRKLSLILPLKPKLVKFDSKLKPVINNVIISFFIRLCC